MLSNGYPLQIKTHIQTEKKGREILHANGTRKKAGVAVLISYKIDFKTKLIQETKKDPAIPLLVLSKENQNTNLKNICTLMLSNLTVH